MELEFRGRRVYSFEEIFEVVRYPSGETHVRGKEKALPSGADIIASNVRTFDDLMHVVSADRILERARWFIPYFPFARDDRRNAPRDGFELGIALEMMKGLDVTILDPHSDVAGQLPHIGQAEVAKLWQHSIWKPSGEYVRIVPDLGASKKAIPAAHTVLCHKKRDPLTGKLSGFEILKGEKHIRGNHCILIDDICDGGGTFLGLAKLVHSFRPKQLDLAVTHGLFTKGTEELKKVFDTIYTTGTSDNNDVHTISHKLIWKRHYAT